MSYFRIIPRRRRAAHLVPTIRRCSKQFKIHVTVGDTCGMENTSKCAWDAMTNLFEILRNEQDHGHLCASFMKQPTSFFVNNVMLSDQDAMISAGRLDKKHSGYGSLNLRDTLNKIAHYDTGAASYRIDGRGAHYLILGGARHGTHWVAEILVSRLCKNAAAAVRAIV